MSGEFFGPSKRVTTNVNEPTETQKPYYESLYQIGNTALTNQRNMGSTLAPVTPGMRQGLANYAGRAPSLGAGYAPLVNLATKTARGDFLTAESNPFLGSAINAAITPVRRQVQENILPQITDQAIAQGAYGGARQDLQEQQVTRDFGREAADVAAGISLQNLANERQLQQNAPNLFNAADDQLMAAPLAQIRAGETERGWNQEVLDDKAKQLWAGLPEFSQLLSSGGFGSQTVTAPGPSKFQQLLQGALGLLGIGTSLFKGGLFEGQGGGWAGRLA